MYEIHFHDRGDADYSTIKSGKAPCVDPDCPSKKYSGVFETELTKLEKILDPKYWTWSVARDGPGYVARAWGPSSEVVEAWSAEYDDEWEYGEKDVKACPARAVFLLVKALE